MRRAATDQAWYVSGLSFECQQCGGCCGGFPGYVWLTDDEIDTIAERLGLTAGAFLEKYTLRVARRYTLKEVGNYDCIMLEDGRCSIYDIRPIQCRTFPFWEENLYAPSGWRAAGRSCPGVDKGRRYSFEEIERLRVARG
jgi:Fe-S-cluster containining protein